MADSNKVIIIGTGVTGLSLAQGLKKEGIPFAIYEKNESRQTRRNWTFTVHWGMDALQELLPEDLFALLPTTQVDPHHPGLPSWYQVPLLNGSTGDLIKILESEKLYRLSRDKLRALLLTDLDDSVHWGKELIGITYSDDGATAQVSFADGSHDTGSVVVGCDGTHSAIRSLLVGPDQTKLTQVGDLATTMCFTQHTREHAHFLRSEPHSHPLYQVALHPAGLTGFLCVHDATDKDHPETWTFFHYISFHATEGQEAWSKKELVQHSKSLAKDFCEPWRSVYEWMDDDESNVWYTKMMHWDPSLPEHTWSNHSGRVTLAGDAAHPMSFQRGQGCNNALQDAAEMFRGLKKWFAGEVGREEVVRVYEEEMKERGGREVRLSAETTRALHEAGKGMGSVLVRQGVQPSKKE
ncbi:hypothetical protein M409DRAFT_28951 [Zasmidium cellare ATCC 36951]|uniref:FAD-binding domain-containing protein n=1 Tax=Zasmidium cellare ATCC 36951 TaxID=1080233 RepID=A0A6A6C598_ZASCE|nr:uncharacterized protein M409DRAFT_28951 [Zasmidium cellare ATCC 36951]KAF2160566.1 hypothetical protein M409DRAFT_28951 [Zasmidium cellare ATCC 36951]